MERVPPHDEAATPGLRRFDASQGPRAVGPGDGKVVDLGFLGVRFMVWSEESGGGFSLVEHPIPPRTLAAPLHRHAGWAMRWSSSSGRNSGSAYRGKENLLALRESYPAGVEFEVRRITARQDLGVGEYVIRYDGRPVCVVAIIEFEGGKVVRETHYFAEPFEAPLWRAQWVERIGA